MKVILVDIIPICEDFPGGEKKGMSFWIMFIQCREKMAFQFRVSKQLSACGLDIIRCGKYYE